MSLFFLRLKCYHLLWVAWHAELSFLSDSLIFQDLYLISDGSTLNENYLEHFEIHWLQIKREIQNHCGDIPVETRIKVHYIFQGRTLRPVDIYVSVLLYCFYF